MNETYAFIYLILWIILVLCDIFIGKSYINAYFDSDKDVNKKKCIKVLFEVLVSVIAGSVFFAMLILMSLISMGGN